MGSPGTILSSSGDNVVVQPSHSVDSSVMSVLHDDSGCGCIEIPHNDVLIERSRCNVAGIWRPGNAVHSCGVKHPSIDFNWFWCTIPHNNFTIGVTRSKIFTTWRKGNAWNWSSVSFNLLCLSEGVSAQWIHIDVIVGTSNNHLVLVRWEWNGFGNEGSCNWSSSFLVSDDVHAGSTWYNNLRTIGAGRQWITFSIQTNSISSIALSWDRGKSDRIVFGCWAQ